MSILEEVRTLLKERPYTTNQLVQEVGAQSADRRIRDIPEVMRHPIVKNGKRMNLYYIPVQMELFS